MKVASFCGRSILAAACALGLFASPAGAANPLEQLLEDFEGGGTAGAVSVTASNSAAAGAGNSTFANVTDAGSKRLAISDADGVYNGAVITFANVFTSPGYYLVTAEVKVDNASSPIGTFGMGAKLGAPTTAKVSDVNAGYVLNLTGTGDAALGYQTIGAAVRVPAGTSLPASLTIYLSTDPSGNDYNASIYDGNFSGNHRAGTTTWAAGSSNAVYVDNIKLLGPGNFGEERHMWISVGDGFTDLAKLEQQLVAAKNNNFNCVDILARYRADAYYIPNRTNTTYPNPEPLGTSIGTKDVSPTNDPLQYAIDRGHELGLKVYAAFSCFLVTGSSTYPSTLPSGSVMWYYNSGSPRAMLNTDPSAEGLWADWARADVRDYTKNVLMDLVANYDIDGIVLDRIRTPNVNYSYNPVALAEMGISGTPAPTNAAFRTARREALTTFLEECYESVTTLKPWVVMGSAPIAYSSGLGDTYNSVLQFWPSWSARPTANRAISFGVMDLYQPQFYRLAPDAPAQNTTLMNKAQFGDIAVYSLDYGLMPGAWSAVAPLFYHPNSGDTAQSNANAQNITDSRGLAMNGFGLYPATQTLADISLIRAPGASSAGVDVLGSASAPNDYLFKKDFDKTPPNGVTNFAGTPRSDGFVDLTWTAPATPADGEAPAHYLVYKSATTPVKEYRANLVAETPVPGNATSYSVPTGFAGTYYYKIVPVDDYNNRGPASQVGPITVTGEPVPPADIIVDNPAATKIGSWTLASSATDKYGADYVYKSPGTGAAKVEFSATIPQAGAWSVSEWHSAGSNRATNAQHLIDHSGGTATVTADQRTNGGKWNALGTYQFNGITAYKTTIDDVFSGSVIIADAIKWSFMVEPPAVPTGVSATAASASQINLSWTDNASNESNHIVLRSTTSGGPYSEVALLGVNVTSYSDTGLTPNTTYYYVVRTMNSGGESANSAQASATTLPQAPAAPSSLTAQAISSSRIDLAWVDNSSNETNFVVSRATASGGPYSDIQTLAANSTSFSNTGLSANTTYWYRVRATNSGGSSANSNTASATTLVAAPAAPSGLSATAVSTSQINLSWTDNSSNETNFVVARSTTSGGPYSDIQTLGANVTSFQNTGLSAGTTYYYVVRATNAGGASANSNQASATTQSAPPDIIVDNGSATFTGSWTLASSATDKYGADYRFANSGSGATATYNANAPQAGNYRVSVWYPQGTNRANNAPVTVNFSGGSLTYTVNQQTGGGQWVVLGTHYFAAAGGQAVIGTTGANPSVVMADAVRFEFLNATAPVTVTLDSVAADDGYVLESGENTNVGGTVNSGNTTFAVGDDSSRRQFKSVVSFDTSAIPDGATIQKVTLKLTQYSINGGDPWASLGTLSVDIKAANFGAGVALAADDFAAAAGASGVSTVPKPSGNNVTVNAALSSTGVFQVSKTAKTQLRVQFATDDDNDSANDYVNFFSGNYSTNTNYRPKLEVQYTQ